MTSRNPMGSISALSLAANPASLPVLAAVAGVAVTVSAAVFTYKAYKHYEEKKHRKEIEAINRLHDKYLSRIIIFDYSEIRGFPPIFKLTSDENSSTADALHYTNDEIEDIGKSLPHGTDMALSIYRESVLNAILKLKEYYFTRKDHHDISSAVLSYLMNMLQTKCLNFEGYDYDIAYLHALSNFINAYASLGGRENSQHFSRLNPVYSYLLTAKQALEKHKEKLSLEELLGELRDSCIHENNLLIRCFAKLVNKNSNWELIKTVAHDELVQGFLRREYVHAEVKGLVLRKDKEKMIPKSIFRQWLVYLSGYYLDTLDPDSSTNSKTMLSPDEIFMVPDIAKLNMLKTKKRGKTKAEEQAMQTIEDDMKDIARLFQKSENFITTELDLKTKNKLTKFVSITDPEKLIERTRMLAQFATIIHQVISLQYLSSHLLKSTKQLGEIYVKNPQHFRLIFNILDQLSDQILESIDKIKKSFTEIQLESLNNMQLQEKELFPEEVKAVLDSSSAAISKLSLRVNAFRDKLNNNKDTSEPTMQSVKHEMFEVAMVLSNMYHMARNPSDEQTDESDAEPLTADIKSTKANLPAETTTVLPDVESAVPAAMSSDTYIKNYLLPKAPGSDHPALIDDSAIGLVNINKTLSSLYETIAIIQQHENPDVGDSQVSARFISEINLYKTLFNKLTVMQAKAEAILNEVDKTSEREAKAKKTVNLIADLSMRTLEFMQLPREERLRAVTSFCQKMRSETRDVNNNFIDEHKNRLMKRLYSVCHISLFCTDTRRKIESLGHACESLAKACAEPNQKSSVSVT